MTNDQPKAPINQKDINMSEKYGECAKHPGNSMIDCIECEMEQRISKTIILTKDEEKDIQKAKDAVAQSEGFEDWDTMEFKSNGISFRLFVDKICKVFAAQTCADKQAEIDSLYKCHEAHFGYDKYSDIETINSRLLKCSAIGKENENLINESARIEGEYSILSSKYEELKAKTDKMEQELRDRMDVTVSVEFAEWLLDHNASHNGFGGWYARGINANVVGTKSKQLYDEFLKSIDNGNKSK